MKRLNLMTAVLAIVAAPALFAQSTLNTTAPGASQETKPGQTNNNLQNPGSNMQQGVPNQDGTMQEHGTVEGTANESVTGTNDMNSQTGTSTGTTGTTETTGTMNNTDSTGTTGSTGSYSGSTSTDTTTSSTGSYSGSSADTTTTSDSLPQTASDLPTVAIAGLLALFAAFALRTYAKRNA